MKKFILFFFAMVLGLATGSARDVVFDAAVNPGVNEYDEGTGSYTAADQSVTIGGVTIASPACVWYNVDPTKNQYRIYKGKDLTITSTVGPIVKVEFTCTASGTDKYGPGCFAALDGYSYDGTTGVWAGEAEELVFHSESNQVRATKIVVTLADKEGEVDFDKSSISAINQADFVVEGQWYLLKQKRNGVSPVYDAGEGATMKRAASDNAVVAGMPASDALDYLLRFIPAGDGAYNIQFANGRYWADGSMTTSAEEPGLYNVYNINGEATHIGINKYDMEDIVDNNGAGNTLAFWASGEVTSLDGNNDWTVWEVEFVATSQAATELKALLDEFEAAYTANNAVVEVGEGIITSTDQFSSPYTCGQDMEPGSGTQNLLDMDGKTYWHSDWSSAVDSHFHYLQVEFAEPISGAFEFNMNRRVNGSSLCANDNPVKMSVEISMDGEEFVLADEFDTPFTQTAAEPLVQATINIPAPAKYLRFFNDESNGGNQRGYWHCGDLQLKPIVTPAPNAAYAEAAAAFAEALAVAKEVGANATDADVAALQAAYEAYVEALTAAPVVPDAFPAEGVAYKFKNVDSQLYVKVVEDAEQCVTLGENPDEMYFTAVEGGWAISNGKGYQLGVTAKGWNIGNTETPIVWTIEEVEGGYAFKNANGYLGFDTAAAGMKAFRDKEVVKHHGTFNIWKFDEEEPQPEVPETTLEETWANVHTLLATAEEIKALNQVELTYDVDGYFEDFTSPIVGKVGYKTHDIVWAVCDGADYVSSFVSYFETAQDAEDYLAEFGGIAALEEILKNVIDDYNAAEVVLPTPGKTYVIRNYPYTYTDEYSYAYYFNGEELALSESANATTAEYMWTVSEPVKYSYFDADLNVIEETRYQFANAADNTKFMSWRGNGTDSYTGVTANAADANSKWYLTGKKVDGTASPAYGTLALRTNADGNQYRTAVVDMRKSTDHLAKSNGDHFDATYSSWYIFEEVEIPVTVWEGTDPVVEVQDETTVKVTFADAHSVEASNYGVLGAVFDEQGDVYGIVFDALFGETVECGSDYAVLHFKKISDIRADLAASVKGIASKVVAAVEGADVKGKVVICGKSFMIDGAALYDKIIVSEFDFNAGNAPTGIDAIATEAGVKVFDLQGRRVAAPAKGLYIREGRKVVK